MESLSDRILALVLKTPGLSDREITDILVAKGAPQQHVNQVCNRLHARRLLSRRARPDGKTGNYPAGGTAEETRTEHRRPAEPGAVEAEGVVLDTPLHWSVICSKDEVARAVPHSAGVYRVLQGSEYPRYRGSTRVLKIGQSDRDLCGEILNHFERHAAANRLTRVRGQTDLIVTVVFAKTDGTSAGAHEGQLLRAFEDAHWDLPLLNSQRGYGRGADVHYRGPSGQ